MQGLALPHPTATAAQKGGSGSEATLRAPEEEAPRTRSYCVAGLYLDRLLPQVQQRQRGWELLALK